MTIESITETLTIFILSLAMVVILMNKSERKKNEFAGELIVGIWWLLWVAVYAKRWGLI